MLLPLSGCQVLTSHLPVTSQATVSPVRTSPLLGNYQFLKRILLNHTYRLCPRGKAFPSPSFKIKAHLLLLTVLQPHLSFFPVLQISHISVAGSQHLLSAPLTPTAWNTHAQILKWQASHCSGFSQHITSSEWSSLASLFNADHPTCIPDTIKYILFLSSLPYVFSPSLFF